ncbi:uncharacterized protein TNCV_3134831 [Trichonephila clavipes]|nr:uncharacterized protein TNCV_3134831 [Trichonephila clavipes]
MSPLQTQSSMVCHEGILYKGTLARSPRCSTRPRTPAAVDQHAAKCLEKAVRSFTVMRSRCRLSRADVSFRHLLPVFRVVLCLSATASKLATLWNCSAAHELLLCIGKFPFSKADNSPLYKLCKLLEFLLISSWRHT